MADSTYLNNTDGSIEVTLTTTALDMTGATGGTLDFERPDGTTFSNASPTIVATQRSTTLTHNFASGELSMVGRYKVRPSVTGGTDTPVRSLKAGVFYVVDPWDV